ncbi:MAG: apolipoprotein N-acyltransferase, partial [Pseudomonadota bacterium]
MNFKMPRWAGDLLCLFAGAILPLAFAPFFWFPVAVLSIALLFSQLHDISPARGFWRGWLYGAGMFGTGVYWIHVSLTYFGGINIVLAIIFTALFALGVALLIGLMGWVAARFVSK